MDERLELNCKQCGSMRSLRSRTAKEIRLRVRGNQGIVDLKWASPPSIRSPLLWIEGAAIIPLTLTLNQTLHHVLTLPLPLHAFIYISYSLIYNGLSLIISWIHIHLEYLLKYHYSILLKIYIATFILTFIDYNFFKFLRNEQTLVRIPQMLYQITFSVMKNNIT